MALSLDDFKESKLTPEDFENTKPTGITLNSRSASQLAAVDSVLTSPTEEDYRRTRQELLNPESRENFILRQQMIRDALHENAKTALPDVIGGDDEITTKVLAAQGAGLKKDEVSKMTRSSLATLAEESLVADSKGETEQSAAARFDLIDTVDRVITHKRDMTSLINSLEIGKDSGIAGKALDLGELMLPFAEWINSDQLLDALKAGESHSVLPGSQKQEIFNLIKTLPLNKRGEFARMLVTIVQNQDRVALSDSNDLIKLDLLEKALVNDDYSDVERYADNVFGLMDAVGLGSLIKWVTKPSKAAKLLSRAEDISPAIKTATHTDVLPAAPSQIVKDTNPAAARNMNEMALADKTDETAEALYGTTKEEAMAKDILPEPEIVAGEVPNKVRMPGEPQFAESEKARALRVRNGHTDLSDTEVLDVERRLTDGLSNVEGMKLQSESLVIRVNRDGNFGITAMYKPTDSGFASVDTAIENAVVAFRKYGVVEDDLTLMVRQGDKWVETTREEVAAKAALRQAFTGTPPVKPGFVRMWHGGFNADSGGSRWFSSDKTYAKNYGNEDGTKPLWYVDVPRSNKMFDTDPTLTNQSVDHGFTILKPFDPDDFGGISRFTTGSRKRIPDDLKDIDYAIALKHDYEIRFEDVTLPELLSPKNNLLDGATGSLLQRTGQGSLTQNLLDVQSVIHPQIFKPAMVAVDHSFALKKFYIQQYDGFLKVRKALPKARRRAMDEYIYQANSQGIKFDVTDLHNRGFNEVEIGAIRTWRKANDAMWYATNADLARSLRNAGNKVFVHKASDTHLIGRPMVQGGAPLHQEVFDVTGGIVTLDRKMIDDLYATDGEVIKLSEPIEVDGRAVEYVLSRNTPQAGYTRAIREGEVVLPYRDGYYPVMYDAEWFVKVRVPGTNRFKVVASARDTVERDNYIRELRASDPSLTDADVTFRRDRRSLSERNSTIDEGSWSLATNSGMTAQRVRGVKLGDAGADLHTMGFGNLVDPLEAVAQQARSLSKRVAMRQVLDNQKARWLANYGDQLDLPINPMTGKVDFPSSIDQIVGKPGTPTRTVTDAKTNFNYTYSLENGYIDLVDSTYKGVVNFAANLVEDLGTMPKLERGLNKLSKIQPMAEARSATFKLLLGGSPVRQAIVQRAQNLQLLALNPKYVGNIKSGLAKDMAMLDYARLVRSLGRDDLIPKGYKRLLDEVEASGVLEAVDAHTFIRDEFLRLADRTVADKLKSAAGAPLRYSQKVGFDAAEQDVLLSSWLAHRDLAIKEGLDLSTQRVKDQILGDARAFTGGMNRAGAQPYGSNTLSLPAQFLSFQHKMLLQPFTHRNLTKAQRVKLLATTTALFGVEATAINIAFEALSSGETKFEMPQALKDGLMDMTFNAALTMASGEDQSIDFGSLAPVEVYGIGNGVIGFLTATDLSEMVANAPAGSLLFGHNPRVTDAFRTAARYFNAIDDYDDPELETTYSDVVISALSMYSGFSSAFKARYAYQMGQKLSSTGRVTEDDATKIEALMAAAGFETHTESGFRRAKEIFYEGADNNPTWYIEDVRTWYSEMKRHLAKRGMTVREKDMAQRVFSEAWMAFGDNKQGAMEEVKRLIQRDANVGEHKFIEGLLQAMGHIPDETVWEILNSLPPSKERDYVADSMRQLQEARDGN